VRAFCVTYLVIQLVTLKAMTLQKVGNVFTEFRYIFTIMENVFQVQFLDLTEIYILCYIQLLIE